MRSVKFVIKTHTVFEGGGFKVRRPVSMGSLMSPFLLLDEMGPADYGPGEAIGAPWHPHRGFETVTYMLAGQMQHEDSAGNKGDLLPGDVQWMTAGRGIIHSEEPHPDFKRKGGLMHGFQIWINLPAKHKMMPPRYQEIPASESPMIEKNGVWARVIAGECLGIRSKIDTMVPIEYIHVRMNNNSVLEKEIESSLNTMIYVFGGQITIQDKIIKDGELALLSEGPKLKIKTKDSSEFLILAGPELNEPIARHGPFVMNTREEIQQAFTDFRNGTFAN
ncbi:MAG: pirin family protein [Methanobacteriota archaeon]|nr:MAG: pirin family protein [Euryarchaeota archaeon]|tara:strand:- start:15251 stop:16081 length:831 start_codon:yes stop_codon:yes gene_type:complete